MSRVNRDERVARLETNAGTAADLEREEGDTLALAWLIETAGGKHPEIVARINEAHDAGDRHAMVVAVVDLAQAGKVVHEFLGHGGRRR